MTKFKKKGEKEYKISPCAEELALALMFILEKGLGDEYIAWRKKRCSVSIWFNLPHNGEEVV